MFNKNKGCQLNLFEQFTDEVFKEGRAVFSPVPDDPLRFFLSIGIERACKVDAVPDSRQRDRHSFSA